ncbi:hypothetical protein MLD38_029901 [Melastoma candidum]|uniref:Uncharacterized protein n=1 Tax=Melastoma candidum TaxID=119954 RepID=A0ACB9MLC9_9MYRT|nr:hypothetical protein MLD38_029901 [Melastoma candidum]
MKPIRDRLDDLHIYNDHSDDSGMSDEEVTNESEGSEEDDWEEQEVIVHTKLSSDELNACTTSSPSLLYASISIFESVAKKFS